MRRCWDSDGRVRSTAADSLLQLYESMVARKAQIDQSHYSYASALLSDSSENVRISGLRILRLLALANPERSVNLFQLKANIRS